MTLPYDYARCAGTTAPLCEFCQRRTSPGRELWQDYIAPAWTLIDGCSNFIDPPRTILAVSTAQVGVQKPDEKDVA